MNSTRRIAISGRNIGPGDPPYVVAEMSGNHNGDLERAFKIIDAAKASGADAVKIQTYRADTITLDHDAGEFVVDGGLWDGRKLFDLYDEAHLPWEWHAPIFAHAQKVGITLFSAPFDFTAVDLLESLGAPAYKIASPEIVDIPLIRRVAATGKPIIISTGMANLQEIEEAVQAAHDGGAKEVAILHCVSAYPTPPEESNLSTIRDLADRLDAVTGLSDHTLDTTVATLAVGLGASIIEKHMTLARADGGVDSAFSLEPAELARLVRDVRIAHVARGTPTYGATESEKKTLKFRRSLYVIADIKAGEEMTHENVRSIRPAFGLPPKMLGRVIGRRASRDLKRGEPVDETMIAGGLDKNAG